MQPVETLEPLDLLARVEAVARVAGDIAMRYFREGEGTAARVTYKSGGSPVTEADLAVDQFLKAEMARLAPAAGWLSEETADGPDRMTRREIAVVDPIDGTRAFMRGDLGWAVSIALVRDGRPMLGVIHAPALGKTFAASAGAGAFLNGERMAASQRETLSGARVVAPRVVANHLANANYGFFFAPRVHSLALRLADVASGTNDLVIAAPEARDWDVAAVDVILSEAGGVLAEVETGPLQYNRRSSTRGMLVAAPNSLYQESIALIRSIEKGEP